MDFQSAEQVKQYLILSKKSLIELQTIASGLQLETTGTEQELLVRLMGIATTQIPKYSPQMFALFATSDESKKFLQKLRTVMFKTGKVQEFPLRHLKGEIDTIKRKGFQLTNKDFQALFTFNMIKIRSFQTELFESLKTNTARYTPSIILNPDKRGNSWLVLHINPR